MQRTLAYFHFRIALLVIGLVISPSWSSESSGVKSKYGALRLSSYEQREHHAWAEYMKARMCLLQEDGGKSGYWDHLGNAIASLPESDYLFGVFVSSLFSIRDIEEHSRLLKAAWEKNRRHGKCFESDFGKFVGE